MNATIEFVLGIAAAKAASEGRKLRKRDADNVGADDLAGQACIAAAAVLDALIDDSLSMNESVAEQLELVAEMIRDKRNRN